MSNATPDPEPTRREADAPGGQDAAGSPREQAPWPGQSAQQWPQQGYDGQDASGQWATQQGPNPQGPQPQWPGQGQPWQGQQGQGQYGQPYAPQYGQPYASQYGQPYDQAGYPPPYPQPGYGSTQAPTGAEGQAYGAYPGDAGGAWNQQGGWQAAPSPQAAQPWTYPQAEPAEREGSGRLGLIGLGLVGLGLVLVVLAGYFVGQGTGNLILEIGYDSAMSLDASDPRVLQASQGLMPWTTAGFVGTVVGITGWVLSIVAFNRRNGRRFAGWGIGLGILAPVLALLALLAGMWPAMAAVA